MGRNSNEGSAADHAPTFVGTVQSENLGYINRAKAFREQGNYASALAELEKAKAIDAMNEEVRTEIDQTKRACNAERVLGNQPNC